MNIETKGFRFLYLSADLSTLMLYRLCETALWVLLTCSPVNLSSRVDRSWGEYRSPGHYGYSVLVHLPTCPPVLKGPEVNIGEQGIMGIPYMLTCRPVNLSPRFDRSRGKYRRATHYGYSLLAHLSPCQPGLTGK